MKKAALLLIAAFLVVTTACSGGTTAAYPTDDVYHPGTDAPYPVECTDFDSFAEVENGYYFFVGNTLLYADADTMEPVPVCAQPNCLHSMEPDRDKLAEVKKTCTAYFESAELFYTNGGLYVLHETFDRDKVGVRITTLTRVSADGTVRKDVLSLEEDEWACMSLIHRGRFYVVTQSMDEADHSTAQLWSYSLDDPREKRRLLYQTEALAMMSNIITGLRAYGNRLYLDEFLCAADDIADVIIGQRIYDLRTGEWTVIENPEGYRMGPSSIAAGKLVCAYSPIGISAMYNAGEALPDLSGPMIAYALDGSDAQQLACESWGTMMADETWIYLVSPRTTQLHADGSYTISTPTDSLYFCDHEMDLVDELPLERISRPGVALTGCMVFPLEGGNVLLYARYQDGMAFYSIDRAQIGTGEITPTVFLEYDFGEYSIAG